MHELGAYGRLAAQFAALSAEAHAKIGEAFADINLDRVRAEQRFVREYAVQELLGKGGFGSVYQVKLKGSGEALYAMKELPIDEVGEAFEPGEAGGAAGGAADDGAAACAKLLEREVGILRSLQHPNIIRYYDSFVEDAYLYIVMELVDGSTLLDHLNAIDERGDTMPETRLWHIFCQVCMALRYCHKVKQVVHRDLTPSNIMLADGNTVKLADFGLVRCPSFLRRGDPPRAAQTGPAHLPGATAARNQLGDGVGRRIGPLPVPRAHPARGLQRKGRHMAPSCKRLSLKVCSDPALKGAGARVGRSGASSTRWLP